MDTPTHARTPLEIQRAHDVLMALLRGETPVPIPFEVKNEMSVSLSVLCWCLGHENDTFGTNLSTCERALQAHGVNLTPADEPDEPERVH